MDVKCPKCGETAERGMILGDRKAIKWASDSEKSKKKLFLTSYLTDMNFTAYVCDKCNLIFGNIPEQKDMKLF